MLCKLHLKQIFKSNNNFSIYDAKYFSVYRNKTNNKNKEIIINQIDCNHMSNHKIKNDRITNMELIDKNYGLREFIKKTYLLTGGGICGSIGLGIVGSQIIQIYPHSLISLLGLLGLGTVISCCGVIGINSTKYSTYKNIILNSKRNKKNINNNNDNIDILYSVNSTGRIISYGTLVSGVGITIVPLFLVFPDALFPAFVASSSTFGASILYAMKKDVGELEQYSSVLHGGLGGLVSVSLMGLGSNLIF